MKSMRIRHERFEADGSMFHMFDKLSNDTPKEYIDSCLYPRNQESAFSRFQQESPMVYVLDGNCNYRVRLTFS